MADKQELAALKQSIINTLDKRGYYEQALSAKLECGSDGWSSAIRCPFHNDTGKPNLNVNIITGGFKCFACGKSGSIFDFWSLSSGLDPNAGFQAAIKALSDIAGINISEWRGSVPLPAKPIDGCLTPEGKGFVPCVNKAAAADSARPPIPAKIIRNLHKALSPREYKYLNFERGLTDATITKYELGWWTKKKYKNKEGLWKSGKLSIPVKCEAGLYRNIRVYAADSVPEFKMLNTKPYGTPPRLFPLKEFLDKDWDYVIYCEGEFDCMLMNQKLEEAGISDLWGAITNTHGVNTFEPEWLEKFHHKHFIFMLDVDEVSKVQANNHATKHMLPLLSTGNLKSLKIVHLPLDGSKEYKDITDYFVKLNGKWDDLYQLIQETPEVKIENCTSGEASTEPIQVKSFVDCIKDREYIDQRVTVPLTISGQTNRIYHACRSFRVANCPSMKEDRCCQEGSNLQIVPYGHSLFIESCMASKRMMRDSLRSIACSYGKDCTVEEVEKVVMQEYYAHQVIKRLTAKEDENGRMVNSQELVNTQIYILQPEKNINIEPQDYMATGYVRSHPDTRQVTLFVEHLEPMEEDWKKFKVTPSTIKNLKTFQNFSSVKEILKELTSGVTRIYESDDILLTVLLTYLSPLWISFNGAPLRGWINSCILGDSGTGKSATYIRISDWLELGDLFSALSGTRTGLLYSIKQKGGEWHVQIGRYVMASGKIIAVDETQESPKEEIKTMGIAMDTGWLEVARVASGGYSTQTRTIFMLNPKDGRKISDFSYGCQAMIDCFDPMFIRRLDIAVFTTAKDDNKFYNKAFTPDVDAKITLTSEAFRSLIYWAWTRTINDIHWSQESTDECLNKALELAEVYGYADDVPLIFPADVRNNVARLATSFAILSGSFTDDYEGVVVLPEHVTKMAKFLDVCYSATSCNLRQHSKNSSRKKTLRDYDKIAENFQQVIDYGKHSTDIRWREGEHFLQLILIFQQQQYIRKRDLMEQLNVSMAWVQKHINILQGHTMVEVYRGGYRATRKFNLFLHKWQQEPGMEEKLEQVYVKLGKMAMNSKPEDYADTYGNGNGNGSYDPYMEVDDPFVPKVN